MGLSDSGEPKPKSRSAWRRSNPSPSVIYGLDLTRTSHWREELQTMDGEARRKEGKDLRNPAEGLVSSMGFRFCVSAEPDESTDGLKITTHDRSDRSAIVSAEGRHRSSDRSRSTLVRTVSIPAPNSGHGELTLVIGADGADVFASKAAWDSLAEPVLLVVAQYARFSRMEQRSVAMQDRACADQRRVTGAGLRTLWERKRLINAARDAHDLVSDWTYFSGLPADPRRYCSSEGALDDYTELATALDIDLWAEGIEEAVSDVEQAYAAISERLLSYQQVFWELVLEVIMAVMIFGLFYGEWSRLP